MRGHTVENLRGRVGFALLVLLAAGLVSAGAGAAPTSVSVIGGTDVASGALPFVVAVVSRTESASYICTGSVIAPNAILTADHCAFDPRTGQQMPASAFTVYAKTTSLDTFDSGEETRSVASVHAFTSLDTSEKGDVAVLTLTTPTTAAPVQLATSADNALYAEDTAVTVAGWGQTAVDGPASLHLKQGVQGLKANFACDPIRDFLPSVQLCAAAPMFRPALCRGDSGGPLLVSTANGWVQIGVSSATLGEVCGADPDYYARVAPLQPWIASQVAGTAAPALVPPPLVGPARVTMRARADGVVISFPFAVADPATMLNGYAIALRNRHGRTVETMSLGTTANAWSFTEIPPGAYRAVVTAGYSAGKSAAVVSEPVTIAAPANTTPPRISGRAVAGNTLTCSHGTWSWAGSFELTLVWLRDGHPTGRAGPPSTGYRVSTTDSGKTISCRVTLKSSPGAKVTASSAAVKVS